MKNTPHIYVNGPVNTVRLEGSVGGIKKVVYLFMDFHADPMHQKKCEDIHSTNVNTFLVEEFDKLNKSDPNKTYDFLFERGLYYGHQYKDYKTLYLGEISDLFSKSFKIDINTNKAQKSDLVPNVRFHYLDARDFSMQKTQEMYYSNLSPLLKQIYRNKMYKDTDLKNIFDLIHSIMTEISTLYTLFFQTKNWSSNQISKSYYSQHESTMYKMPHSTNYILIKQLVNKLMTKYENDDVKKKIRHIIDNELHALFVEYLNSLDSALMFVSEEMKRMEKISHSGFKILFQQSDGTYNYGVDYSERLSKILRFDKIDKDMSEFLYLGLMIMDLYKLRRILDKKYITNSLAYTGGGHSNNYIRLLVKYFGFKITHYSYLKTSIPDAEKIIKQSEHSEELNVLFYPHVFGQCSDLGSFPKLFD